MISTGATSLTLSTTLSDDRPFGDAAAPRGVARGWDFLGNVPVPLRQHVRDDVARWAALERAQSGVAPKCCFPMGQGGQGPFERLRRIRDLADFPAMLVSAEHGNAFNRAFHAAHVETGAFTDALPDQSPAAFIDGGLIDPKGWIGVFATAPFVLLVDRRRLGDRPSPRRWSDLLDPMWRNQIVFGGWRREGDARYRSYNAFLLLCILRDFGPAGLQAFLANVGALLHSMQMPRVAGTSLSVGGIYILPWSLADMCPRRAVTEMIWPEEGAYAYPLWMTVKQDHRSRLDGLIGRFNGPELGRYFNANLYPSACPDLPSILPAGTSLRWPGWTYLRHSATANDVKLARRLFRNTEANWNAELRQCA